MREIKKTWKKKYKPLKLFKDDLEAIVNIAKEYEQSDVEKWQKKIEITAENYQLDNISELEKIKKEVISYFGLNVGFSSLRLQLSKYSLSLEVGDDNDILLIGIATKIDSILQKRQRRFNFVFTYGGRLILCYLIVLLCGVLASVFFILKIYYLLLICIIAAIYIVAKAEDVPSQCLTIIMSHSAETPNFFKRNKDKILVNTIVAIIVSFLSVLGTLLFQWITKNP